LGYTDSGGYVKFTPKYIIVGGEGGWVVSEFLLRFQSFFWVIQDHMPHFKIKAYLLLGCTESGGYVKFTPKIYIFLKVQIIFFGNSGPHAKFQNRSLPPSGLFLLSVRRRRFR
jgi:hypothetical protein